MIVPHNVFRHGYGMNQGKNGFCGEEKNTFVTFVIKHSDNLHVQ